MVKFKLIICTLAFWTFGCTSSVDLDMQHVGESAGVYIEAFCEVGELYNLLATKLAPIDEPQLIDLSHKFEVNITDTERHKLSQFIFEINNKIYSHGSPERVPADFDGNLELEVISEDGEVFRATSTIPKDVTIEEVKRVGDQIVVSFDTDADAAQNYFAITLSLFDISGGLICESTKLATFGCNIRADAALDVTQDITTATTASVSLLRLNDEGYRYMLSVEQNFESSDSVVVNGTPLDGNIDGAIGIFTCYSRAEGDFGI